MKVRKVLRRLKDEGWVRMKSKGGHRQFKHPNKPGRRVAPGTLASIFKQAGWTA